MCTSSAGETVSGGNSGGSNIPDDYHRKRDRNQNYPSHSSINVCCRFKNLQLLRCCCLLLDLNFGLFCYYKLAVL